MSDDLARIDERNISLIELKLELKELYEKREQEENTPEERAAFDGQIKQYIEANIRKVDNIRLFWRYCEDVMAAAERDEKDAAARKRSAENKLEFLKSLCHDVMVSLKEKKLEGAHGFIRLQTNGGSLALDIYSQALVPEELVSYTGWMSAECMAKLPPEITARQDFQFERATKDGTIKARLETKCDCCGGDGKGVNGEPCTHCAGTGFLLVPGARLSPRGQHVRIR